MSKILKQINKIVLIPFLLTTLFIFNINNAMAEGGVSSGGGISSGNMSSNGLGKQLMSMGQEAASTGGLLFTYACYLFALVLFFTGTWAFYRNYKEPGRHNGLIILGITTYILTGISVSAPTWINLSANTASHGDAQYYNDKTGIIDIE